LKKGGLLEVKRWLWGWYARVYGVVTTSIPYKEMMSRVASMVLPNASVMDVGCGTGGLLPYLNDVQAYTGIDAEPEMLKVAGKTAAHAWRAGGGPRIRFIQGSATGDEEWPYANTFVLCNVLYALDNKPEVLKSIYRRMPNNCHLILCDPDGKPDISAVLSEHWRLYEKKHGRWELLKHRMMVAPKLLAIMLLNRVIFQEFQFVSQATQQAMLEEAGFKVYGVFRTYSGQNSLIQVIKSVDARDKIA